MGIFDTIKGEAKRNFIARADTAKGEIIYKYPENNIRMLTQLTVDADEVALFVKDGKVEGKLGPGRHQLDSNNIPFLSALVEKFTGGNLFVTEVFFVSVREFAGVKFGGPIGDVRDPETGLGIGTMVYGDFSIRVTDPEKLVVGLVGMGRSSNEELLGWFKNQVLKVTRDRIAELLVKKRWPLLDVTSGAYTEEIETEVISGLKPHVDGYGLTVVRMGNFHVSIKEEDEGTLKKLSKDVAYSRLAGGFQQYAQGQAMLGAAEGMAKGGDGSGSGNALGGMGMGMGFGMAQQFMNQQGQQQRPQEPAQQAAPADTRSPAQRLKEIKELKDAGVLSDEEYNAKRAELMKLL
ncbi:SPFH domain-containing protein [Myxococcus sp. CA051A]|uniref:SPFH domain-containing protein n=1 Tax=Myxococcus llanfairpwllgwyngyllgogerychwyrndrobwllllantysiliogogogochensis TaxID=2590453 RepID=A0A540WUT4_9BACT|nr:MULTISPECIES: SPFH domain-containing protein [Myxococcus]NTX00796.1 SPFH domain-containing protein [Myxococcus sp. CA040A]NTX12500.1 SPFH domain-containing protein [Myxococcus sp. CA056]NTX52494.1 SPFH domain-containing protein [Myxococcus sp. CA039A]NTX59374.1 SPFH domain-containing protein [Myxococcus sp. CA051A]TQF12781.1 SPFH domain-containing protein [Myxococcus llanfairpwllgwyngyllgogerychwyrndrobwllllantysiliogogogochensis]